MTTWGDTRRQMLIEENMRLRLEAQALHELNRRLLLDLEAQTEHVNRLERAWGPSTHTPLKVVAHSGPESDINAGHL